MEITRKIDWLQYTHHDRRDWWKRLPTAKFDEITGDTLKPLPRYEIAYALYGGGRADIGSDDRQGVQITLGGAAVTEWQIGGVTYQQMITDAVSFAKVVRLDFATDIRQDGTFEDPLWRKIGNAADSGDYKSRLKAGIQIKDKTKGGYSQYFGSYKSDQFIRCYDKAIESGLLKKAMEINGILPVWTRVELVCKRDYAHNLASDMAHHGWQQVGAAKLRKMIEFPSLIEWQSIIDGLSVELTQVTKKEPKFWQWLENQVLPAMRQKMLDYDENVRLMEWLAARLNETQKAKTKKRK